MLTGILAGFLSSHSVMLGRYFTWLIRSDNYRVFVDTFAPFRAATQANLHYNLFLWASVAVGALWTVSSFAVRKDRLVALIAGLSSLWVGAVFFASWNLPMHASFVIFYTACILLLLLCGSRARGPERAGADR